MVSSTITNQAQEPYWLSEEREEIPVVDGVPSPMFPLMITGTGNIAADQPLLQGMIKNP